MNSRRRIVIPARFPGSLSHERAAWESLFFGARLSPELAHGRLHPSGSRRVRFSNPPFGVKHFLTDYPPLQH